MKHFILTRFNEFFPDAKSSYWVENTHLGLDLSWLKRRLCIFFNVTLPSLANQSNKNFVWILKCHYKTPMWVKAELNNIAKEINTIIIDYEKYNIKKYEETKHYNSLYECRYPSNRIICKLAFQKHIEHLINDNVITTRLDSDDAISFEFVEKIQKTCKLNRFVDFEVGAILCNGKVFEFQRPLKTYPSQFCSYMEVIKSTHTPKTVFFVDHTEANPCDYINEIGWLQVNHDMCLNNHRIFPSNPKEIINWRSIFKGVKNVVFE